MSWNEGRVREMVELFNGYPFDSALFNSGGDIPLVRIRDMSAEKFETFVPGPIPLGAQLRTGDLVIGMDGDFNAMIWTRGEAALNQRMCALRPRDGVDIRWVFYNLPPHLEFINETQYATTVKHLSSGEILSIRFPLPPQSDQIAICDFLDRETAKIDVLIAKQQQLVETLREDRAATIFSAVTEGLDREALMTESSVEWIDFSPKHWNINRMSWLFRVISSGTTPDSKNSGYYEGVTNWVTTGELREGYIDDTASKVSTSALIDYSALRVYEPGSLVIAMYGATIGRLGILSAPACTNQACCVFAGAKHANVKFMFYMLLAAREHLLVLASGGGQPNINQDKLRALRVPTPSVQEQRAIAAFLDARCERIDAVMAESLRMIATLREYRSALITDAVTGKIDVRGVA
ncbi:hypothetical protein CH252_33385 [Rhodococcus sp. 06-1477-1B]|uniref:restriction endonuclease subunit S n=1 Tax=Rhodococcus sp. 06-1474-1B TaxID=2022499 RepID=UPI000B9ADB2F|nr:restriction endonuclease subunit S [Rhodococcus sp. 06-1474-1B]OZD37382.1 hypothetical protein CH252_33385 [Rhodococcus sp. 06-1477-1B]OZD46270.1 hypothetical protein CH266_21630 [Rhodococcus sp. 06-1474-1B]